MSKEVVNYIFIYVFIQFCIMSSLIFTEAKALIISFLCNQIAAIEALCIISETCCGLPALTAILMNS